eukprot:5874706-Pyramimonas_sp.AAC.1
MPSQLQGAISTLMLKLKQQEYINAKPSFRSIGMLPALYRVWARLRRSAAREWEYHHKDLASHARRGTPSWNSSMRSRSN